MHPTALPGPGLAGDIGPASRAFIDWLADAKQSIWQVLPLHPVGPGFSPYASPSAFAGGPHLLSLSDLVDDGLLDRRQAAAPTHDRARVEPAQLAAWRAPRVALAARALAQDDPDAVVAFAERADWVADWALYCALTQAHGASDWRDLPPALANREPDALAGARHTHAPAITHAIAIQALFDRQWSRLRAVARDRGVTLVGDMPLFVATGGADVWRHRDHFRGQPDAGDRWRPDPVTGAPPDFYSPTGQRWGTPHHDWPAHAADGFSWWVARVRALLDRVDVLRVDHFRGLVAAWAIPAAQPDATGGAWEPGPGRALFDALEAALGPLPLIVEDLGDLSPAVHALRDALGLPGLKILQQAFDGDPHHPFLPHNFGHARWVACTGTHDTDTAVGWYAAADSATRHQLRVTARGSGDEPHWELIRLAWASVADTAVAPLQDVLGLGSDARFNTPGQPDGCWRWRATALPTPDATRQLAQLTHQTGRAPLPSPHTPD